MFLKCNSCTLELRTPSINTLHLWSQEIIVASMALVKAFQRVKHFSNQWGKAGMPMFRQSGPQVNRCQAWPYTVSKHTLIRVFDWERNWGTGKHFKVSSSSLSCSQVSKTPSIIRCQSSFSKTVEPETVTKKLQSKSQEPSPTPVDKPS